MTVAQHTPGPWALKGYLVGDKQGHRSIYGPKPWGSGSAKVAQTQGVRPAAENEANARLIAAAPELLEALEELHLKAVVGTDEERHAALIKAWAAISKARGA